MPVYVYPYAQSRIYGKKEIRGTQCLSIAKVKTPLFEYQVTPVEVIVKQIKKIYD